MSNILDQAATAGFRLVVGNSMVQYIQRNSKEVCVAHYYYKFLIKFYSTLARSGLLVFGQNQLHRVFCALNISIVLHWLDPVTCN